MSQFRDGDRVRCIEGGTKSSAWKLGREFTIKNLTNNIVWPLEGSCVEDMQGKGVYTDSLEMVSNSKKDKDMDIIQQFRLSMKGEPEKSFIKAGIMDINENLTNDGKQLFIEWLLKENGDQFKKEVVDPILADMEADKK